jgi:hypothetical protein
MGSAHKLEKRQRSLNRSECPAAMREQSILRSFHSIQAVSVPDTDAQAPGKEGKVTDGVFAIACDDRSIFNGASPEEALLCLE